ncbi:UNVERIFIED_CONTAM: RNA helicase [Siphonaria sp. JEL0065]|nr:RNA helicase [Siphonaria sp. JEL0065]
MPSSMHWLSEQQTPKQQTTKSKLEKKKGIDIPDPILNETRVLSPEKLTVYFKSTFSESNYIKHKCKDIGIEENEVSGLVSAFTQNVLDDKLSYMRLNVAMEALADKKNMERLLLPALYEFILHQKKEAVDVGHFKTLMRFADLRTPAEWYPEARLLKRDIILHVGPTNSGKTYSALKRLEGAKTGIYAGPLRLLAHEVYERLNNAGSPCNLLTGEERRESDGVEKWSCTVEMSPLNRELDVAVIDEIQMIGDDQRGWAWTQALLGLRAKEIHLCGEATVIPLIKRICESTGDSITINTYNRLTPLNIEKKGFHGSFSNVRPGDCIVTFSRRNIFALRKKIESYGQVKAAVIYGGLPPETRAEQAKLFNDPNSGYTVLVASDAIGMGLNLNIKRVVLERLDKFNGSELANLSVSQIKQIAGRAGRYKTQYQEGYVCTLHNGDMRRVRQALATINPLPLPSGGLNPTLEQMEKFATEIPEATFAELLDKFEELSRLDGDFFLCNLTTQKDAANLIQEIDLTLQDRYTLVSSPADPKNPLVANAFVKFAKCISDGEEISLQEIVRLPDEPVANSEKLRELESFHKVVILYLWLGFRFPSIFTATESASHLKRGCEDLINRSLDMMHDKKVEARVDRQVKKAQEQREKEYRHQMHNRPKSALLREKGALSRNEGREMVKQQDKGGLYTPDIGVNADLSRGETVVLDDKIQFLAKKMKPIPLGGKADAEMKKSRRGRVQQFDDQRGDGGRWEYRKNGEMERHEEGGRWNEDRFSDRRDGQGSREGGWRDQIKESGNRWNENQRGDPTGDGRDGQRGWRGEGGNHWNERREGSEGLSGERQYSDRRTGWGGGSSRK